MSRRSSIENRAAKIVLPYRVILPQGEKDPRLECELNPESQKHGPRDQRSEEPVAFWSVMLDLGGH